MRTRDASGFDPQRSRVVDRAFLEDTDMIYFVRPDMSDSGEKRTPSCIALQKPVDDGPWVRFVRDSLLNHFIRPQQ